MRDDRNVQSDVLALEAASLKQQACRARLYTVCRTSIPAAALLEALRPLPLPLPTVDGKLPPGFPSPADDFLVKRHDLNELLITRPKAIFFWQVSGQSMCDAGIADGDILVVNRALKPRHGSIVVAQVDGDFTVKILF